MSLAEIPQLQKLTIDEKLELISELWDSIDRDGLARHEVSEAEKAILEQRLAQYEAHPERVLTIEEFERQFAAMRPSWGRRHGL